MSYTYRITASENNTEIRFISLKDYDPNDSYELNGKEIKLLNIDGTEIVSGWSKDVPVPITLNEDKTIGYVNINEKTLNFNPEDIDFLKVQKEVQFTDCTAIASYGDYIYTGLKNGTIFPELVSPYEPCQSMQFINYLKNRNNIGEGCNG